MPDAIHLFWRWVLLEGSTLYMADKVHIPMLMVS